MMSLIFCMIAPLLLTAQHHPVVGDGFQDIVYLEGHGEFAPKMVLYADAEYKHGVYPNTYYPDEAKRFYWDISTSFAGDRLAISSCAARPTPFTLRTDAADSEVRIVTDGCPLPEFDVRFDPVNNRQLRFSMRRFRFPEQDGMHISCNVVRCAHDDADCGTCQNPHGASRAHDRPHGGRRLDSENTQGIQHGVTTEMSFSVRPGLIDLDAAVPHGAFENFMW